MAKFFDRLMELCEREGTTPRRVAKDIGIKTSTLSMWKTKGVTPNTNTIIELAKYFATSPEYLLGSSDISGPVRTDRAQQTPKEITFNITPDPEWVDLETKLKNGTITPEELQQYKDLNTIMAENTHRAVEDAKLRLQKIMKQLNDAGLQKVVERAEELTEIPRYRAETTPQSLSAQQEGTDTTPPTGPPETPPEGE